MRLYSKVRVDFGDESLIDFAQILHNVQSEYEIGFAALTKVGERISLFMQRHGDASCMSLNKIRKICNTVTTVAEVTPFNSFAGRVIESYGNFRARGPARQITPPTQTQSDEDEESRKRPVSPVPQVSPPTQRVSPFRGLANGEQLLVLGGRAYACREVPLPSDKSTFCAVYGSSGGIWTARFWVGPIESLGVKDKKCVTDDQKAALLKRQSGLCQECSSSVSIGSYSNADIDHIIPRHLGGKTVLENLQIICVPCHRTKTGLESKAVRRIFPGLELEDGRMYAVGGSLERMSGVLIPLEYMRDPVGILPMDD